jgi:hypothetical protein
MSDRDPLLFAVARAVHSLAFDHHRTDIEAALEKLGVSPESVEHPHHPSHHPEKAEDESEED